MYANETWGEFHMLALEGTVIFDARINLNYEIRRTMTKVDGKSDVQLVPEIILGHPITLHLARMNRFNDLINRRVSQWLEAGLFTLHFRWGMENINSTLLDVELEPDWAPMPLTIFPALFGFFGAGIFLAILAFICELIRARISNA